MSKITTARALVRLSRQYPIATRMPGTLVVSRKGAEAFRGLATGAGGILEGEIIGSSIRTLRPPVRSLVKLRLAALIGTAYEAGAHSAEHIIGINLPTVSDLVDFVTQTPAGQLAHGPEVYEEAISAVINGIETLALLDEDNVELERLIQNYLAAQSSTHVPVDSMARAVDGLSAYVVDSLVDDDVTPEEAVAALRGLIKNMRSSIEPASGGLPPEVQAYADTLSGGSGSGSVVASESEHLPASRVEYLEQEWHIEPEPVSCDLAALIAAKQSLFELSRLTGLTPDVLIQAHEIVTSINFSDAKAAMRLT